jgi:methionyl-tRNA formyltransferase
LADVRILFWGTPEFAVPSLRALDDEGFEIAAVVTRPDRPAGRGRRLTSSAVKDVAGELGLEVLTPDGPRGEEFLAKILSFEPDLSIVVAYGHILRREILRVPRLGSINVHASLLPELRGAAPVNWAIIRGHEKTGVTIMRMVEEMDAGPILFQVEEPILPDETASELATRLSELGAEALVEALALLAAGTLEEVEQDHARATFAPKISRETARIDWARPAHEVARLIRGMDEVPGAWTTLDGDPIKLFRPTVVDIAGAIGLADAEGRRGHDRPLPGTVLSVEGALVVATGDGALAIREVHAPGARRMPATDWVRGRRLEAGRRFA